MGEPAGYFFFLPPSVFVPPFGFLPLLLEPGPLSGMRGRLLCVVGLRRLYGRDRLLTTNSSHAAGPGRT